MLSKPDYGQITVLWSAVFITISTLYRPIEQLLSRHISERRVKGQPIGQPMRVASTIQLGLSLLFAVLALALRGPIQNDLLEGNETLYWVFFSSVLFYAASYFARGFLAGAQRFGLFVALILSESCFRTLFAVLVAIGLLSGQSAVAVGIIAAPSLSLIVVPFAFVRRAQKAQVHPTCPDAKPEEAYRPSRRRDSPSGHGGGFAAAVLVIMFSEQAFLNAGPLITRGLQGAAAAGFIFNVLMIARAPLQLFQSVSTSILPHLTTLHTSDDPDSGRQFHHTVRMVLLGIAAFTALVVARRPDRRAAADAARLQQEVHLRPGGAAAGHARDGPLPRLGDRQPGLHRPGPGAARRGALDLLRGRSSSPGTSCRSSPTSSAASRSASCSPPASSSPSSTSSTAARTNGAEDVPEPGSPEELEARLA